MTTGCAFALPQPEFIARFSYIIALNLDAAVRINSLPEASRTRCGAAQGDPLHLHLEDFRNLFERAPSLFLVLSPDLTIVAVTDAYLAATMTRREDIIGRKLFDVFPDNPHDAQATGVRNLAASLQTVLQTKKEHRMAVQKYDIRKPAEKGGAFEVRYWSPLNCPVLDDDSNVRFIIHRVEDVTELVRLGLERERSRKDLQERYRLLIESMSDYAIFTLDPTGIVTSWNPGAEQLKGYSPDEIIGQHFSRFYMQEDRAAGLPQHVLQTALQHGHYQGEGWRVRKDGSRFWASVVVTPLRSETGELIGFSKITRDMTDRKRLMDQLQEHASELEMRIAERDQSYADLEAFSYSVAHDLRAPLRAIEGFTDTVLEDFGDQLPTEARTFLQLVIDSSNRMEHLISDLLQYSKITRTEITCSPVDIRAAVDEALQPFDAATRSRISTSIEPGLTALAHRPTLIQAVFNLVSNALKFYPPGVTPHAEIKAFRAGDNAVIAVHDEGIGIEPRFQEQIFKIFERLHAPDRYPGTGIGLAIVERGVARMGGKVRVESALGKGSTFTIEVPAT